MTTNSRLNSSVSRSTTEPLFPTGSYRPSVPLSVYRELAKELQVTQHRVDRLELQNQQLLEQNKQLRQQIEQVIEATQKLQQVVEPGELTEGKIRHSEQIDITQEKLKSSLTQSVNWTPIYSSSFSQPEPYTVDVEPNPQRSVSRLEPDGIINGWVLAIAIFLIIVTSCTGAFLIVSSKFNPNNR